MILVVTRPGDEHAEAVRTRLEARGARVACLDAAEIPARASISVRLGAAPLRATVRRASGDLDLVDVRAVWFRRLSDPAPDGMKTPEEHDEARNQTRHLLAGLAQALAGACRWVNEPLAALAADGGDGKLRQLQAAREVGLEIPETLASNDPGEIRAFLAERPRAVWKPFRSFERPRPGGPWVCWTREVDDALRARLDDARHAPYIFQEEVPKRVEIRATVMGDRVFACEVRSQETEASRVDYRRCYTGVSRAAHILPVEVHHRLVALHRALGLVFGTADLVFTPDGRYVFLETNQQGQWLWTADAFPEHVLVDAFCDMLTTGGP